MMRAPLGMWTGAGKADVGDAAVADDDDGIGNVVGGVAPVGDVDDRAAGENQGNGGRRGLGLRPGRNGGQAPMPHSRAEKNTTQSHGKISLMWIVAHAEVGGAETCAHIIFRNHAHTERALRRRNRGTH